VNPEIGSEAKRKMANQGVDGQKTAEAVNRTVEICKPETERGLDDEEDELGSDEDLEDCQEGRVEIPDCQEGNGLRSAEDLTDCQEDSQGILHCQLGNDQRSLWDLEDCPEGSGSILNYQVGRDEKLRLSESLMDSEESSTQQGVLMKMGSVDLIVCQEGSGDIPYFQVGRDEQMRLSEGLINSEVSWNQPEELAEQMERDQQVQLTEEKDQDDLLMIGGIGIFLPCAQEEEKMGVADGATTEQSQLTMTVREELE
jgi:hypothetical protein